MRGDDVRLVHKELRQLGFNIVDRAGFFGSTTFVAVQEFQRLHNLRATGSVNALTARAINTAVDARPRSDYLISGTVVRADGSPVARAKVSLLEKKLRCEEPLGQCVTDALGMFEIVYPQPDETPFSALVRASSRRGREIAVSNLICDVKPVEEMTLVVDGAALRGPSEYVRLEDVLRPALVAEKLDPADLNEEDVDFLACNLDLDPEHVALFVVSARHHRETDVMAQVYYGMLRQGLSSDLKTLIAHSPETLNDALVTSVGENIIDPLPKTGISRILRQLQNQIVRLALQDPEPDRPTFSALFEIAGVKSRHRQRILADYVDREGTVEEYWRRLRDDPDINNDELDRLQETLKLSTIALNHVDLVHHIVRLQSAGTIGAQLRDLSRLLPNEWRELLETEVDGKKIGAPEFFGKNEAERIERYAEFLPRMVESIFPTAVLTHRIADVDPGEFDFTPALGFLNRNPDFEFRDTLVQTYLDENPDALVGIPDAEETVTTLKSMQRLFEVAPALNKTQAVATLMAKRVNSATAIRRMGPTQFIRQNREALGFDGAQEMYTRAARKADTALYFLSRSLVFNPVNPAIIAPHLAGQGVPDLEDLFGSLDLCTCEHCNSVCSPAAYTVDILHYLMNRPTVSGGGTALDVLFNRRPDLGKVELNCDNTNTVLPYVDLVLEILETAVVGNGQLAVIKPDEDDLFFPFQTTGETGDLAANPEHLNVQAYDMLRTALYPWSLPFDLWYAEVRIYLGQLGVPFHQVLEQFSFADTEGSRAAFAAERLDLTAREREIITDAENDPLHQLMGFDSLAELNQFMADANAAQFIDRSGLNFEELTNLLNVRFVGRDDNLSIRFDGPDCDLDGATITNLDRNPVDRMQRFVRLWRKQDWSISELGKILQTLNATNLSDNDLIGLAQVKRLQTDLKVRVPVLLNWLAENMTMINGDDHMSIYEQVFLDPAVHKPELAIFELAGDELVNTSESLNDHVPIVYSALGISAAGLGLLIDTELPNTTLDISNLTRLYQAVSLLKKLKLSIPEYITLRGLSGIDPFGADAIDELTKFVELTRRVQSSPFAISQLDYLLRHLETAAAPVGADVEDVTAVLVTLRIALYQIALEHRLPDASDTILQMTENKLTLILSADGVSEIMAIVNKTSTQSQEDQISSIEGHLAVFLDPADVIAAWIDDDQDESAPSDERALSVLAPLLQHLRRISSENLVVQVIASAHDVQLSVAERLLRTFRSVPDSDESFMEIFLADGFVPAVAESEELSDPDSGKTTPNFEETTNLVEFSLQYAAYYRLAKVTLVLRALGVPEDKDSIEFFFTYGVASGWLDLNTLPLVPIEQPATELDTLLNMVELFQTSAGLFGDLTTLFGLLGSLEGASTERLDFLKTLASLTGWDNADIVFLTGPSALNIAFPDGFRDGQFLVSLKSRFQVLGRLSVSAEAVQVWATQPVTVQTARAVKQVARARYENKAQWLTVAKPLRDELREQQRAALVAYLVHNIRIQVPRLENPQPTLSIGARRAAVHELQLKLNMAGANPLLKVDGVFRRSTRQAVRVFQDQQDLNVTGTVSPAVWIRLNQVNRRLTGPNELYAHFLIDVEMDPCMLTSRIVLANSSIQLFVQRCLLNLEPEVELSLEDSKEWAWMKQYRLWEANRKVFLYPENWIYPELRNNKTPLFKELESGILQDEINETTIEREYLKYLNGLNQVAQLEISGLYRQWEVDRDTLHVVARTQNAPRAYFYRKWIDQRYWTAWEKVDADIEGDHLVPVVWNRRLYLFWPIFEEQNIERETTETITESREGETVQKTVPVKEILKHYNIKIAWSEYRDGGWSPKQISVASITTAPNENLPDKSSISFWPQVDDNNRLYILTYGFGVDPLKQFRFAVCDGTLEVTGESDNDKFSAIAVKVLSFASGQGWYFNGLVGLKAEKQALNVITSGTVFDSGIEVLSNFDETKVLRKASARFRLVIPSAVRHFKSQTSFAYYDQWRTFLITPRGTYSGGFSDPDLGLTFGANPTHVPIELPDSVTRAAATYLTANTGGSVMDEPAGNITTLNRVGELLAPITAQTYALMPLQWKATNYRFENHHHPYVCLLIEELNRYGIDGVLKPDPEKEKNAQRKSKVRSLHRQKRTRFLFNNVYRPVEHVVDKPRPRNEFDFEYGGAYSVYNWELFFHAPLMLAKRLSDNQRFAEAHRWFHYMFDPTYRPKDSLAEPWPERVWQIKPFFEQGVGQSIQRTMLLLKSSGLTAEEKKQRKNLQDQIEAWRKDPLDPHLIAGMRPEAYMKTTVMAYIDNLIAWADHLFGQDTGETVNEATQLYILAAEILGKRPTEIAAHENTVRSIDGEEVKTFNDLRGRLDAFSNVMVELETLIEPDTTPSDGGGIGSLFGNTDFAATPVNDEEPDLPLASNDLEPPEGDPPLVDVPLENPIPAVLGPTLFFCIPGNDKLLGYWDTVADRLFKIRHCMNIEGIVRQLPLFQPPIDPGLLVKAAAAGVDISSVLNDLNAPLLPYRFEVLLQKATELTRDVVNLGASLLSVLEKRDVEALALLRSNHEVRLLESVKETREQQIKEAQEQKRALEDARSAAQFRSEHYEQLVSTGLVEGENSQIIEAIKGMASQAKAGASNVEASEIAYTVPDLSSSFGTSLGGSVSVTLSIPPSTSVGMNIGSSLGGGESWGGSKRSSGKRAKAEEHSTIASVQQSVANLQGINSSFFRRQEEWDFQQKNAENDMVQLDSQIEAATIRIELARHELRNHETQMENAREVGEFMRSKYTNQELYSWMVSQISTVYFQSYKLAFDLAKRAEKAFQHELGVTDTNYIKFGYWDNLKKGLLSGEKLHHDLKRLDVAYLEENRREYEITQHFSLALLGADALLQLRETGECEFSIPELAFDVSYPGQYMRRIKSVSVSVPCVTGPYTNVSARLTLQKNRVRLNGGSQQEYRYLGLEDTNFRHDLVGIQSIATSSGQNDSGLFQLNFQDERYLPFERAGAISTWRLSLPNEFRNFDYDTISDVILHLNYTARDGGDALRSTVEDHVGNEINRWLDEVSDEGQGLLRLISLKHEFSSQLHHLLFPAEGAPQGTTLSLSRRHFPHFLRGRELTANRATLVLKPKGNETIDTSGLSITLNGVEGSVFSAVPAFDGLLASEFALSQVIGPDGSTPWELLVANGSLDPEIIGDISLLITYRVATNA